MMQHLIIAVAIWSYVAFAAVVSENVPMGSINPEVSGKRLPTGFFNDIPKKYRDLMIKISYLPGDQYAPFVDSLDPGTKAELLKYVRAEAHSDPNPWQHDGLRLGLRDEVIISREIKTFIQTGEITGLAYTGMLDLIPRIAPFLYREEPPGDFYHPARSVSAAYLIGSLLERSYQVSPEVQRWGRVGLIAGGDSRNAAQRWWEANRTFIEQGRYDRIQPGEFPSWDKPAKTAAATKTPPNAPAAPVGSPGPGTTAKESYRASTPETERDKSPGVSSGVVLSVAVVALLAGLLFWWKRRTY